MTSPIDNFDAEQERLSTLVGDPAQARVVYCIVGRHEVDPSVVRVSPNGRNVCRACQATPAGRKEMQRFDPLHGYREQAAR